MFLWMITSGPITIIIIIIIIIRNTLQIAARIFIEFHKYKMLFFLRPKLAKSKRTKEKRNGQIKQLKSKMCKD